MRSRLAAFALLAAAAADDDPKKCPWCRNDPTVLAACGGLTHEPATMARDGVASLRSLPGAPWRFLETAHFRIATSLGAETVTLQDRARVDAELAPLRAVFTSLPPKPAKIDPWLRLHLYARRTEALYARFQSILRVTDADFPESRGAGPFMGDGKYLGEKDKFELYLHARRETHNIFTRDVMGVKVTDALRWHLKEPAHKCVASMVAEDADLRFERLLIPHSAHNVSHLLLCAYKHFSFDPPIWLDEGLAHALEREGVEQLSVTYCADEGAAPDRTMSNDWAEEARSLLERGKAATLAELMHKNSFGDLTRADHVIAWSKVRFLLDAHGDAFAKLVGGVKGQLDERGYPSGRDLPGLQRTLLRELFGWTPDAFDRAWAEWVRKKA
ncbi:MAG TPA: hypothetical protein VKE69_14870 [Planctomycetota bacterium]|nr:hypothetical protein [Planctomycetota bacterium]